MNAEKLAKLEALDKLGNRCHVKHDVHFQTCTYNNFLEIVKELQQVFTLGDVAYIMDADRTTLVVWYRVDIYADTTYEFTFYLSDMEEALEKLSAGKCHIEEVITRKLVCNT